MPQLDPTWYASQIFWMLLTFCMMFLIMWRFVMPLMRSTVDARRSKIEKDIQETEKLKNEAAALIKELDAAQALVKTQTQAIFAQAQEEAQNLIHQSEADFNTRLSAYISEKEEALEQAKKAALLDIAAISSDLTASIIQKTTGIKTAEEEIKKTTLSVMKEKA